MGINSGEIYSKIRIIKHIIIWMLAYISLSFVLNFSTSFGKAAFLSFLVIVPLLPPVYLNNYFIEQFFLKRKYWQYFTLLVGLIVVFGIIAQLLMNKFHNVEGEYFGAMLNPLVVLVVTAGIKGFRENMQNKYNVIEARAKQAEAELNLSEAESKQIKAELDLLRAQVNPHFLFNTLNSIYSLSLDNSSNAPQAIMLLSKLMRYQLETSKTLKVNLSDEVDFINSYIELEKLRFGKKCIVDFEVAGVNDTHIVSPLLLVPIVENCFKHGISIEKKKNEISIKININGNRLKLKTMNFIPEKKSDYTDDKKVKTGIANIKRRLKLLYDNRFEYKTEQYGGRFYTKLIIEL